MDKARWWQTGVIYQIYPRSFQDSNRDGVGDLRGIVRRLPYLAELGVDALWLSPIFTSPMADFGYDISDYIGIDPLFGTLADFDALVAAGHEYGLKIILDLVPNHTSDQHPWFHESRFARTSPKRDWYIWHDPAPDGGPPNNWLSSFGGSAWQFDGITGQYYYHAFLAAQPDLNWRSPEVRAAIYDVMRFWFRRGVDGFRIDVIWHLIKDDLLRPNPLNPDFRPGDPPHHAVVPLYTADRSEVHDVIAEMRRIADEFSNRVLIGETYLPIERLVTYYGRDLSGVHLPFNFSLLGTRWHPRAIAKVIDEYEAALPAGGWPNWVLGNHDQPRVATRVGQEQARVAAMLLLTLRGTPTLYYGDEIGMEQVTLSAENTRDPVQTTMPGLGRDGCRTPMQWDRTAYAGFSSVEPWLPISPKFREINVARQLEDANSFYGLIRRLTRLRKKSLTLQVGSYQPMIADDDLLLYERVNGSERLLVALNLGAHPQSIAVTIPSTKGGGRVLVSTYSNRDGEPVLGTINLLGNEGAIVELCGQSTRIAYPRKSFDSGR